MRKIGLIFVLMLVVSLVQAAPKVLLNNTTDQAYQVAWYIAVPDSHQVIEYQQNVTAHSNGVVANPGVVYQSTVTTKNKQPVTVTVAAYAKGSQSQFADSSLAVKLFDGNQLINDNHFALTIELRESGIAVFIKSLGTSS
jgi:hypothetical protein